MLLVSRDLPQFQVVDVGAKDLLVPPTTILYSNEFHECVVDMCPTRVEKAASGTQFMEEVELVVLKRKTDTRHHI